MKLVGQLSPLDQQLVQDLRSFVPSEVFDIHAHLITPAANLAPHLQNQTLGLDRYVADVTRWLPTRKLSALAFGFPSVDNDRSHINAWMEGQIRGGAGGGTFRGLVLTSPADDPAKVAELLAGDVFVGIKPYHVYAPGADTSQAKLGTFAPEWMWELCHAHDGVLMLHVMRDAAINDEDNLAFIHRMARKYSRCQLVLAHVGRSFSYRSARTGLQKVADLGNVWVDTSAISETETLRKAIEVLGPHRVMYGSDYPISELRGRCVATGNSFTWIYSDEDGAPGPVPGPGEDDPDWN